MVGRNLLEHSKASKHEIYAPSQQELNLNNQEETARQVAIMQPDMVIHAAGIVGGIQKNIAEPVRFLTENTTIGFNVITAAYKANIPALLNLGSSCMYPREAVNPLREEYMLTGELEPTNEGYALSKIACARLCEYMAREKPSLFYKTIIPCNLYGKYDKFDTESAHMVPSVIKKLYEATVSGTQSVEIWGDGEARREFMYVEDLADFIFSALDRFENLPPLMNVGLGHDHSINDYYSSVAKVVGYTGSFYHNMDKPTGMQQKLVDITKQRAFGWEPSFSLEDGIANTFNYYREALHD